MKLLRVLALQGSLSIPITPQDILAGRPNFLDRTVELPNEGEPTIAIKAWMTEDARKLMRSPAKILMSCAKPQAKRLQTCITGYNDKLAGGGRQNESINSKCTGASTWFEKPNEVVIYGSP